MTEKSFVRSLRLLSSASLFLSAWLFPQSQIQVGYTTISADPGSTLPVGAALFSFSSPDGVLVSQAGVAAVDPIAIGRIFVDQSEGETGFALVNPSLQSAGITLILRDSSGSEVSRQPLTLDPGKHTARFVSEFFKSASSSFNGSMTFESTQKLAAITLRQSANALGEPLYTTLPVVDLSKTPSGEPLVFPQIAAGGGYSTQVILINATVQKQKGTIALYGNDGTALALRAGTTQASWFGYEIPANGTCRIELEKEGAVTAGYAVVAPDAGNTTPSGSAVFRYQKNGKPVTEAGVGATPATANARILVDGTEGYTGVALVNGGDQPLNVTFTLRDRAGSTRDRKTVTIADRGHLSVFVGELFPSTAANFIGLMDIASPVPMSAITLKLVINAREDLIYTTLPVADMNAPPSSTTTIVPQIALGGGFSTRLLLINADKVNAISGQLNFFRSDGSALGVPYGNNALSRFAYQMPQGGGTQFFPGNRPAITSIRILDPDSNLAATEIVVNEGNTIKAKLQVLDETGTARDDAMLNFASLDPAVAAVDQKGNITGKKAGFSTVTIASGSVIATGTITVVKVDSGLSGYIITGIVQDMARRLYLAATQENIILQVSELDGTARVYAGIRGTPGYKDDERLKSLFSRPAFLACDQASGLMYVSDGANNAIRYVQPGSTDKVATLAGSGKAGSQDGVGAAAAFNNPQGVAVDGRGYLWVADSGNHTVRRINLMTGKVETIAGKAGSTGTSDGSGEAARFNTPAGIALEIESIAQQLNRAQLQLPPPAVSMIVADRDNGLLRRVKENGSVETIKGTSPSASGQVFQQSASPGAPSAPFAVFNKPTGVTVDAFGNIFVTEPEVSKVRAVLSNGAVVSATERGTLKSPTGLASMQAGRVLIADSGDRAKELSYGAPQITRIDPARVGIAGGEQITISGNNFGPDSIVVVAGTLASSIDVRDSQTIRFKVPSLRSGLTTLTVQNRGGIAQNPFHVVPVSLNSLPAGYITTVAGGTTYVGDGGPALEAPVGTPAAISVSSTGDLYIASRLHRRIRHVESRTQIITTVAGNGELPYGELKGGLAVTVPLTEPVHVAVDRSGDLYICEYSRIRKVAISTGVLTTIAGGGWRSGDDIPATQADIIGMSAIAVDLSGNLYIAEHVTSTIRRVDAQTGLITTVAGTGVPGYSGDNGPAARAQLNVPTGLATDSAGNIFISDSNNNRIRRVDALSRVITTIAGTGRAGTSGGNGPALDADINGPWKIATDPSGNLLVAVPNEDRIRRINTAKGIIETVAGGGQSESNGVPATEARLYRPIAVAADASGNIYIAEESKHRILMVEAKTGRIAPVVGSGQMTLSGDGVAATSISLNSPMGIALNDAGALFVAELGGNRVGKVDPAGTFFNFAGTLSYACGDGGDNAPAISAGLCYPSGLTLDTSGNLYIVVYARIRKVLRNSGIITTFAGNGQPGFSGDGGLAGNASLSGVGGGIVFDKAGSWYVADTGNNRIRKIDSNGIITTVAGNGQPGYAGDGGLAANASLQQPASVALDADNNLYISDYRNNRVRKVDSRTAIISTVAGNGTNEVGGDNQPATAAPIPYPAFVVVGAGGDLFIACSGDSVRRVNARTNIVTTVAGLPGLGAGTQANDGDNGPASKAELLHPSYLAFDAAGNLYISDQGHNRIRAIRAPIP